MVDIVIEIKPADHGALAKMAKMTDEERKMLLESQKLVAELKRLENQNLRLTHAQEQRARSAKSAIDAELRASRQIEQSYTRRMNLRHGADMVLTQAQRQMLRQGATGQAAQAMLQPAQDAQFARYLRAQEMRSQRAAGRAVREADLAQQRRAERAARDTDAARRGGDLSRAVGSAMATVRAQRAADYAATNPTGTAAIGFAAAGGRMQGEDAMMSRARRAVSRNIGRVPELMGRVTEEEFETMAQQMRTRMERSAQRASAMFAGTLGVAMAGGMLAGRVDAFDRDLRSGAGSREMAAAPTRRELRQLAENQGEFSGLLRTSDAIRAATGMKSEEANQTTFAVQSAGFNLNDAPRITGLMKRLNMDSKVGYEAAQKLRDNFGAGAGGLEQMLGNLIIAAGPSPADVSSLAGGVGTAASSFRAIGGNSDELLSMLGVLSGPTKNVDSAAERIKSVSDQLARKNMRINWAQGQAPKQGMDMILSLPRLAQEGRLMSETGKAQSLEMFLGEGNATAAVTDILTQEGTIRQQMGRMAAGEGKTILAKRAGFVDPVSDTVEQKSKAEARLETVNEKVFGKSSNLADAVAASVEAENLNAGKTGVWGRAFRSSRDWSQRSSVFGTGDDGYISGKLFAGQIKGDELLSQVFSHQFSKWDTGNLKSMANGAKIRIADTGATGTFADSGTLQFWGGAKTRELTGDYERLARESIVKILESRKGPGTPAPAITPADATTLQTTKLSGELGAHFKEATDGYAASIGAEDGDYRVQLFQKLLEKRRAGVEPQFLQMAMSGDRGAANSLVMNAREGFDDEFTGELHRTNLGFIDSEVAVAEAATQNAALNPAKKAKAVKRLRALQGIKNQALRDDGVIDEDEAQGIVNQIKGDSPRKAVEAALQKSVEAIANNLTIIARDGIKTQVPPPVPQPQGQGAKP